MVVIECLPGRPVPKLPIPAIPLVRRQLPTLAPEEIRALQRPRLLVRQPLPTGSRTIRRQIVTITTPTATTPTTVTTIRTTIQAVVLIPAVVRAAVQEAVVAVMAAGVLQPVEAVGDKFFVGIRYSCRSKSFLLTRLYL